ncbi:MAG TPA: hypothetical protein VGI19_02205 [Candidatus Cybelea sp.]|jgi:streptogramin lyase
MRASRFVLAVLGLAAVLVLDGCGGSPVGAPVGAIGTRGSPMTGQGFTLEEYPLDSQKLQIPYDVVFDAHDRLWLNSFYPYLGVMRHNGHFAARAFQIKRNNYGYESAHLMAVGPDHNLWFTDYYGKMVGRVDSSGNIEQFQPFTNYAFTAGIVTARKHLWVVMAGSYHASLVELDTKPHVVKAIALPGNYCYPGPITVDATGTFWIGNSANCPKITRVTPDDRVTDFPIVAADGVWKIVSGPDGNVWFAASYAPAINPYIGKITPQGNITVYPVSDQVDGIALGPDGNWWLTMPFMGRIATMSLGGQILAEYDLPNAIKHSQMRFQDTTIILGPDGNLWFAEPSRNKIGELRFQRRRFDRSSE